MGLNGMQAEFIKLLNETYVKWLTEISNNIYNKGNIPQMWLESEFIVIPKKLGGKRCSDYRIISLMSHMLNLFLKI